MSTRLAQAKVVKLDDTPIESKESSTIYDFADYKRKIKEA